MADYVTLADTLAIWRTKINALSDSIGSGFVNLTTVQTIAGAKTLTDLLTGNAGFLSSGTSNPAFILKDTAASKRGAIWLTSAGNIVIGTQDYVTGASTTIFSVKPDLSIAVVGGLVVGGNSTFSGSATAASLRSIGTLTFGTGDTNLYRDSANVLKTDGTFIATSVSTGTLYTSGLAQIGSNATVAGTLGVTGAGTFTSTLAVTGATSLSTLGVSGLAALAANLTIGGTTVGTGAAAFQAAVQSGYSLTLGTGPGLVFKTNDNTYVTGPSVSFELKTSGAASLANSPSLSFNRTGDIAAAIRLEGNDSSGPVFMVRGSNGSTNRIAYKGYEILTTYDGRGAGDNYVIAGSWSWIKTMPTGTFGGVNGTFNTSQSFSPAWTGAGGVGAGAYYTLVYPGGSAWYVEACALIQAGHYIPWGIPGAVYEGIWEVVGVDHANKKIAFWVTSNAVRGTLSSGTFTPSAGGFQIHKVIGGVLTAPGSRHFQFTNIAGELVMFNLTDEMPGYSRGSVFVSCTYGAFSQGASYSGTLKSLGAILPYVQVANTDILAQASWTDDNYWLDAMNVPVAGSWSGRQSTIHLKYVY
jgi:hypothetical protein